MARLFHISSSKVNSAPIQTHNPQILRPSTQQQYSRVSDSSPPIYHHVPKSTTQQQCQLASIHDALAKAATAFTPTLPARAAHRTRFGPRKSSSDDGCSGGEYAGPRGVYWCHVRYLAFPFLRACVIPSQNSFLVLTSLDRFMAASKVLGEETINGAAQASNTGSADTRREHSANDG